jgi:hypothetical protein
MASNPHLPFGPDGQRPRAQSEVLLHDPAQLSPELYATRFSEPDMMHVAHGPPVPKSGSFLQQQQKPPGITFMAQPKQAQDDLFAGKSLPRINCYADPRSVSTSDNGASPTSVLENPFTPRGSYRRSHKKRSSPLHRHSHRSNRASNQHLHQQQASAAGAAAAAAAAAGQAGQAAAAAQAAAGRQLSNLSHSARWSQQESPSASTSTAPSTPSHDVAMSEQEVQQPLPQQAQAQQQAYFSAPSPSTPAPQPRVFYVPEQAHQAAAAAAAVAQAQARQAAQRVSAPQAAALPPQFAPSPCAAPAAAAHQHQQQQQHQHQQALPPHLQPQPQASSSHRFEAAPGPAAYSTTTPGCVLAVSPHLPGAMQRPVWGIQDYAIVQKIYTGYASTVYKVGAAAALRGPAPRGARCFARRPGAGPRSGGAAGRRPARAGRAQAAAAAPRSARGGRRCPARPPALPGSPG